jgi:ClpP class serine protease
MSTKGLDMVEFGDIFWGFIIIMFIYPYFVQWWVDRRRNLFMRVLGRKEKSQIITVIHTPSKLPLFGLPFLRMIDMADMEEIIDAIRLTPKKKPIDVILHVTGGAVLPTAQIARALKNHPARTRVIVPYYAMSGGTLISLAADEIVMAESSILGPIDPQILTFKGALPLSGLKKVAKTKGKKAQDETLMMASLATQATKQLSDLIIELISDKVGKSKASKIADYLTKGDKTHDYPITAKEGKKLGLNIKVGIKPEVYNLMGTYKIFKQQGIDVLYR